jgi:hypothetical protein
VRRVSTGIPALIVMSVASCATSRSVRVDPETSCTPGNTPGLSVHVADPTGEDLPGVAVLLPNSDSSDIDRRQTDRYGLVTFTRLPPSGVCALRGELPGFEATQVQPFPCRPECHTTVRLRMRLDMRNAVTFTQIREGAVEQKDAADEAG